MPVILAFGRMWKNGNQFQCQLKLHNKFHANVHTERSCHKEKQIDKYINIAKPKEMY